MNMTKKSDEITQACHDYGVRIVHVLPSKRMQYVEKQPGCSDSVLRYLDRKINTFNNHIPVHYPDTW